MKIRTCLLTRAAILAAVILVAVLAAGAGTAMAQAPTTTTFSGTVYYKNFNASGATVSLTYGMQTFSTTADEFGRYQLTVDYLGSGKAVLIASYSGDTDSFTWYPEAGAHIVHDFWITPRPAPGISEGPTATFTGRIYYGGAPAKDAHVIIVYGKYIIDQYANDTGHYSLTVYNQGMPGRLWATYKDGRSEDYWANPGHDGTVVTDIQIAPKTGIPTATPAPTPGPSIAPTGTPAACDVPATPTPAPSPGLMLTIMAVIGGCALLYRVRK